VAALLHVLRKRADKPSDWALMQFNAAALDVVPLHDDDTEFTAAEIEEDIKKRLADSASPPDPTPAAAVAVAPEIDAQPVTTITSLSSPKGSGSGRGNGRSSSGKISASSRAI
jgi:hypothetical protein